MKNIKKILLGTVILAGVQFGLGGCIADVESRGYYRRDPWYNDGPWMDGGRWGEGPRIGVGVGIDLHPPGFRR
jgi:peptidoglycan hydrolase-like protein with peptidoglycan-binding domain